MGRGLGFEWPEEQKRRTMQYYCETTHLLSSSTRLVHVLQKSQTERRQCKNKNSGVSDEQPCFWLITFVRWQQLPYYQSESIRVSDAKTCPGGQPRQRLALVPSQQCLCPSMMQATGAETSGRETQLRHSQITEMHQCKCRPQGQKIAGKTTCHSNAGESSSTRVGQS